MPRHRSSQNPLIRFTSSDPQPSDAGAVPGRICPGCVGGSYDGIGIQPVLLAPKFRLPAALEVRLLGFFLFVLLFEMQKNEREAILLCIDLFE